MTRFAVVAVLVAAAATALPGSPATAQTGPLPVTPGAGAYLPAAEAIGDGWREIGRRGIAPGPALFREGAKAVDGGPHGARAVLVTWVSPGSSWTTRTRPPSAAPGNRPAS